MSRKKSILELRKLKVKAAQTTHLRHPADEPFGFRAKVGRISAMFYFLKNYQLDSTASGERNVGRCVERSRRAPGVDIGGENGRQRASQEAPRHAPPKVRE